MTPAFAPVVGPGSPAKAEAHLLNIAWGCDPGDAPCIDPGPSWISRIKVWRWSGSSWILIADEVDDGPNRSHDVIWEDFNGVSYAVRITGWRRLSRCADGDWSYEVRPDYLIPYTYSPYQPYWVGGYYDNGPLGWNYRYLPYSAPRGYLSCKEAASDPPPESGAGDSPGTGADPPPGAGAGKKARARITVYTVCLKGGRRIRSTRCPRGRPVGALFKSSKRVRYRLCVRFPGGRRDCARNQLARARNLYLNKITGNRVGRYKAIWFVQGRRLIRQFKKFR